jgi:ABC-2 type transport system ATP-binding protein
MITLDKVDFWYAGKKQLFTGLCLTLKPGNIYGLLGPNGAGKTTLLKLLAGFLRPKSGNVSVGNVEPFQRDCAFLDSVFMLPEELEPPPCQVDQFGDLYGKFYTRYKPPIYRELCRLFGLEPKSRLDQVSMGQSKKALIAFALAIQPQFLLLDEPTNGLDIPGKETLRTALLKYLTPETLVIIATHQVREVSHLINGLTFIDEAKVLLHTDLNLLNERLHMTVLTDKQTGEEVLYQESAPNGYVIISRNNRGEPSEVDIEVLFKAVLANPDEFKSLFSQGV